MRRPGGIVVALGTILCVSSSASAQGARTGSRWEVEVHGGGGLGNNPTDGNGALPPAGDTFLTNSGQPSRRASSWYLGDGAALLNGINATFGAVTGRITPLDPVLKQSATTRGGGGSLGARVGYAFTPRFGVELSIDAPLGSLQLTDAVRAGVEATRASFIQAWNAQTGLMRSGGGVVFSNSDVTSVASIDDKRGRTVFTTAALTLSAPAGKIAPYATIGAGVVTNTNGAPSVTLTGNYHFNIDGTFPVNETDTATIRVLPARKNGFVTVFGGSAVFLGPSRWGVRADVRAYVSGNTYNVLVDANPQVATLTPAGFLASLTSPSIQFSNNPSNGRTSTLSGAVINGFKTFTSSGTAIQIIASAGYVIRF